MTRQWHSDKVQRKPYERYNPSFKNNLASAYKPWLAMVAAISCVAGVATVAVAIVLKDKDNSLETELNHLWVGIPLLVYALVTLVNVFFPKKKLTVVVVLLSFVVAAICVAGAFGAGFLYWKDGYRRVNIANSLERCTDNNENSCTCVGIESILMPKKMKCEDLDEMIKLVLTEIAFAGLGFVTCVFGLFVSFMSLCCTPWMYFEMYDPRYDIDMGNEIPGSTPTRYSPNMMGDVNKAYSSVYGANTGKNADAQYY